MISSILLLPHGLQIIPGVDSANFDIFKALHEAMNGISLDVDTIVIITPHGYTLQDDFLLYGHDSYTASYFKVDPKLSVVDGVKFMDKSWKGDTETIELLNESLTVSKQLLVQGSPTYPLQLAWGESVPLYYHEAKIVILSIPRRRFDALQVMKQELMDLGGQLFSILSTQEKRYALMISADLSHTHDERGPYGYHVNSKHFDTQVIEWMREPSISHLEELLQLNSTALACGMAGLCILQGVFDTQSYSLDMQYYDVPTYFGMCLAKWS
ncbi:MAG: hypothetical protein INQ03_05060 [Candidatus Heimdallarchaeota archaeon]|nr:hypothetical protein [Candidatus Heimdallarchaeota archaeon]